MPILKTPRRWDFKTAMFFFNQYGNEIKPSKVQTSLHCYLKMNHFGLHLPPGQTKSFQNNPDWHKAKPKMSKL